MILKYIKCMKCSNYFFPHSKPKELKKLCTASLNNWELLNAFFCSRKKKKSFFQIKVKTFLHFFTFTLFFAVSKYNNFTYFLILFVHKLSCYWLIVGWIGLCMKNWTFLLNFDKKYFQKLKKFVIKWRKSWEKFKIYEENRYNLKSLKKNEKNCEKLWKFKIFRLPRSNLKYKGQQERQKFH